MLGVGGRIIRSIAYSIAATPAVPVTTSLIYVNKLNHNKIDKS